jgi:hypothetical protein
MLERYVRLKSTTVAVVQYMSKALLADEAWKLDAIDFLEGVAFK